MPKGVVDLEPGSVLPRHVAIIMDGNGRWAEQRQQPRVSGHRAGVEAVGKIAQACGDHGIEVLTLFAFSSENWQRPQREVALLLDLFMTVLNQKAGGLHENNVRLKVIGDRSGFPKNLRNAIDRTEDLTADNAGLKLVIAANYGGRWDIAQALQALARKVTAASLSPADLSPDLIRDHLSLAEFPEPDLFIRTGGEQRVSNFLLWHIAYTELYFTDCLWPDFGPEQFQQALDWFATRQRRFGRTSEQVVRAQHV